MYEKHWGFQESPFRNALDPALYFASGAHEEAIARAQFLVENRRPFGILTGLPGTGKSYILQLLRQRFHNQGVAVGIANLAAARPAQWLFQVAVQLGAAPPEWDELSLRSQELVGIVWRQIVDRLMVNRLQQRFTVFLFDDLDKASLESQQYVGRLLQADPAPKPWLAAIAIAQDVERIDTSLLDRCELHISLEAWEEAESTDYLRHQLKRSGTDPDVFSHDALRRIHLLSHGVPRRINQLADLALLAGAGQQVDQVEGSIVEAVFEELSLQTVRSYV